MPAALPESQCLCLTESQSSETGFRNLNHAGVLLWVFFVCVCVAFFFNYPKSQIIDGKRKNLKLQSKITSTLHCAYLRSKPPTYFSTGKPPGGKPPTPPWAILSQGEELPFGL